MAEAKDTFGTLKKASLEAPVLAFANFNHPAGGSNTYDRVDL